jgi:hypothetical protein
MSWIKMRVELASDPAVMRLTKLTGLDRFAVIGRLHALWSWFDVNSACGQVEFVDADDLANVVGSRDFVDALCKISWLKIKKSSVELPNFSTHNGPTAKERSQKNQRQARWRERKTVDAPPSTPVDKKASTREEKRREENKPQGLGMPAVLAAVDNLRALHPKPDGDKSPKPEGQNRTRWFASDDGIIAQAKLCGVEPRPGETFQDLKKRVFEALARVERQGVG